MAESSFNLFGPLTQDDIRVGYISTDRGYVDGMSVCQANVHAQKNPGSTFIFKPTRDKVQFLTINEVNKLDPNEVGDTSCPEGLSLDGVPKPPRLVFMGGGGVGVVGNPVIGNDGSVMAIDMVHGGFGYKYPPLAEVRDDSGIGAGAVIKVEVGEVEEQTIYYSDEEEFEEPKLCPDPFTNTSKLDGGKESKTASKRSAYGRRWTPEGEDLGSWQPQIYTDEDKSPFADVVDQYIKLVQESGKDWWTTRKKPPLKITSAGRTTRDFYKVQHWEWGGTNTPLTEVTFDIHWSSPHRTKGLGFEFTARDGSHSFKIVDSSRKHDGSRKDVYRVKENVTYDIKVIGKRPSKEKGATGDARITELAEMGLLKKLGKGRFQKDKMQLDANKIGTGDKIFADFLDTLDDDDDIQIQANRGRFTASNLKFVQGVKKRRKTYDLTYRLQTGKEDLTQSFMNKYAISPVPPSNVKGSDESGKWYTFEWDETFPYNGDYIFRGACDNLGKFYLDGQLLQGWDVNLDNNFKGTPTKVKKNVKKGNHTIRLDLYNGVEMRKEVKQQPPSSSTSEVVFKITSGSMFSNGIRIEDLNIDEVKPFTPPEMGQKGQLNVTHTRKIEFGKKYKVIFTSKGQSGKVQGQIKYTGLHSANSDLSQRVSVDRRRINLRDGHGRDTNVSFTIESGKGAKFSADGTRVEGSGNIKIVLDWNDNPGKAGVAVDTIQIGDKTWRRQGKRGSQSHVITLESHSGAKPNIKLRTKGSNVIQMEDFTDEDWTDIICTASSGQFTDLKGNIAYFSVPYPTKNSGKSAGSNNITQVFNTVDYINKANRQLWRTNVYNRGGFLNDYGVCPFDTKLLLKDNPYAGTHKISWPSVNFPIDGNYDIEVEVDDNVKLTIGDQVDITKNGFIDNTSVGTGKLKITKYIKKGNYNIDADLHQIPGGSFGFKTQDGKKKERVKFNINVGGAYGNQITIPGLLSIGKDYKAAASTFNQEREVEIGKEYDVIITTVRSRGDAASSNVRKGAIRFRTSKDGAGELGQSGPRLEYEDRLGRVKKEDHGDIIASVSQGKFYNVNGNRCKFMVGESMKGINPMALAINIQTTFTEAEVKAEKSWNENPMGAALTIEAPDPPVPQEPIPQQEGRCPNNPFWTTRFPGAKKKWFPVRYDAWGELMNKHAISPLPPYDEHRNPLVDVSFEVFWSSPHRTNGLGYKFASEDGSHSFTIIDNGRTHDGTRNETHKVKLNTTYNVKAIGRRTAAQGSKIGTDALGGHDNSKVIELAEQGLLKQMGRTGGNQKGSDRFKLKEGTGDKIFADFLDTLDDADDIQIQAGAGQFTASNPKVVHSLRGTRKTYDLTYRISETPANDAGSFTNTWTREFPYGGFYKVKMAVDNWGELWIDDKKVLDLGKGKGKATFTGSVEKLVYIDGPTTPDEDPVKHDIKIVVENQKSQKTKSINQKVFNTVDWIGGGISKAESKIVNFKITSAAGFANGIKIPELGVDASKRYNGPQINQNFEREVEVNKVYEVEVTSTQSREGVRLRNRGESVLEMEEHSDNDWKDIVCSATHGRFFDFKPGANKATCKFVVTAATKASGAIVGGTRRDGVTYQGPHLFHYTDSRWGKIINNEGVSPIGSPTQSLSEPNDNILGNKILSWKGVNFPHTGTYDISFVADNGAQLFIDGKNVLASKTYELNEYITSPVQVGKGKHDIRIELDNAPPGGNVFLNNPTGTALRIYIKTTVGSGTYKSWKENPLGVSAKLIPPPCPKKIKGKGVVVNPTVLDPGNGYIKEGEGGYPAALKLKAAVILDEGINYDCSKDTIRLEPSNGSKLSLCKCGPFGKVEKVCIDQPGFFTEMPNVIVDSDTGVNLEVALQFEVVRDPVEELPLIQVTDLVGLKQTGYYKGRPYYGAVFYQDGVKYAGWYETAGELVQIYDTMQESIDAQVTTPPSAILRQGSDVSSNDPKLNIPGTPENLI